MDIVSQIIALARYSLYTFIQSIEHSIEIDHLVPMY